MSQFVPWNSQPLNEWSDKYAQGKFVDLDGRTTHYLEKGFGPNVILIHGFFLDSNTWKHNLDALAAYFKVHVLDLWGFGYSTREPLDYGYPLYTEQLLQFMDALGIESASLVGHSMGGGTAINFSVNHPDRVEKLLLVDPVGMPHALPLRSRLFNLPGVAELFMGIKSNFFRKMNLKDLWFHKRFSLSEEEYEQLIRFHRIKGTTPCLTTILRKEFFNTLKAEVGQLALLQMPVKLVWGNDDRAVPLESGKAMHEMLQRSRFQVFKRTGHTICFERPEAFNKLALDFLQ